MGVFKEHARAFEAVAAKQKRIYRDACDYGYPYNTQNVPDDIKLLIHYANDLKGTSLMRSRNEYAYGVDITFRIGWENDEGFECGTEYRLSFNRTPKHAELIDKDSDAFIEVLCSNYREPYKNR